jgi:hypothetical protein
MPFSGAKVRAHADGDLHGPSGARPHRALLAAAPPPPARVVAFDTLSRVREGLMLTDHAQ